MSREEGKVTSEVKQDGGDSLTRARSLYKELKLRERDYRIADFNWGQKPGKYVKGHKEVIQLMLDRQKEPDPFKRLKYLMIQGGNGSAKCHRAGDRVIMFDMTTKPVEDVVVGDMLMGPDGTPRTVLRTGKGFGMIYEVKPDRFAPFYVNADHIMPMVNRRRLEKGPKKGQRREGFEFVTVKEWVGSSKRFKHERKLKIGGGFDLPERTHDIPPYMLGLWLGDGSRGDGAITTADNEVEEYVRSYAESIGGYRVSVQSKDGNKASTYHISRPTPYHEAFIQKLRKLGLGQRKFIPNEYLNDSRKNRLELLAGLIDTDGCKCKNAFTYLSTDFELADGVRNLACSLGFAATIFRKDGVLKRIGMPDYRVAAWCVRFAAIDGINVPCLIPRKLPERVTTCRDVHYSKPSVKEVGEDWYYGFELDGDHLYMTDNWIIQHNSQLGAYLVACLLTPDDWKRKLGLPFVGKKKEILVITKSGDNVKDVIDPYLLGEGKWSRVPPDLIADVHRRDRILKNFTLKDGTHIRFSTYDQGREVFQGKNPDFVWMDEEAIDPEVWTEALMRTRTIGEDGEPCMLMCTMTPLAGPGTPMVEFFNEPQDPEVDAKKKLFFFDSRDNPFADVSLYKTLKGHEFQQRVLGIASVPTGLVYYEFRRDRNIIPHFDPIELGAGTKFYAGIDFGVSHPTAIVVIAVDGDSNHYVFDCWKKSNASLKEIADQYKRMTSRYALEYGVGDSAALRERHELNLNYGIKLLPVDKFSKGENGESNRRAGIMLVNQLMSDGKFVVSENCRELTREIENHYYKDTEKDGSVVKERDDLVDVVRYICTTIKKMSKTKAERAFRKKYGVSWQNAEIGDNAIVKFLPNPY